MRQWIALLSFACLMSGCQLQPSTVSDPSSSVTQSVSETVSESTITEQVSDQHEVEQTEEMREKETSVYTAIQISEFDATDSFHQGLKDVLAQIKAYPNYSDMIEYLFYTTNMNDSDEWIVEIFENYSDQRVKVATYQMQASNIRRLD